MKLPSCLGRPHAVIPQLRLLEEYVYRCAECWMLLCFFLLISFTSGQLISVWFRDAGRSVLPVGDETDDVYPSTKDYFAAIVSWTSGIPNNVCGVETTSLLNQYRNGGRRRLPTHTFLPFAIVMRIVER